MHSFAVMNSKLMRVWHSIWMSKQEHCMFTGESVVSASAISSLGKTYRQHIHIFIFISSSVYKFNLNYTFVCHTTLLYRFPHFTLNSIQFNRVNVPFHPKYTHSRPFSLTIFQCMNPHPTNSIYDFIFQFSFFIYGKIVYTEDSIKEAISLQTIISQGKWKIESYSIVFCGLLIFYVFFI